MWLPNLNYSCCQAVNKNALAMLSPPMQADDEYLLSIQDNLPFRQIQNFKSQAMTSSPGVVVQFRNQSQPFATGHQDHHRRQCLPLLHRHLHTVAISHALAQYLHLPLLSLHRRAHHPRFA
jgi:hypothetical protein